MKITCIKLKFLIAAGITLLIAAPCSSQQLQFKDFTLGILQSIAYTTTYNDFLEFEKEKKIDITRTINANKTESISFTLSGKEIKILYAEDHDFIYATTNVDRYESNDDSFEQLEENGFKVTDNILTKGDAFGPLIRYFNKNSYPYEFVIYYLSYNNTNEVYIFNKEFGTFANFKK